VALFQLTLAGAAQFTGVDANTGLVDFTTFYVFAGTDDAVPVIYGYTYDNGAGTADLTIVLREPGGAATERFVLFDDVGVGNHFRMCNPGMVVPRTPAVVWEMAFITLNKAADASIAVHWAPGRVS
jgi:hypothetical protein